MGYYRGGGDSGIKWVGTSPNANPQSFTDELPDAYDSAGNDTWELPTIVPLRANGNTGEYQYIDFHPPADKNENLLCTRVKLYGSTDDRANGELDVTIYPGGYNFKLPLVSATAPISQRLVENVYDFPATKLVDISVRIHSVAPHADTVYFAIIGDVIFNVSEGTPPMVV